jgi:hypothetical protein
VRHHPVLRYAEAPQFMAHLFVAANVFHRSGLPWASIASARSLFTSISP